MSIVLTGTKTVTTDLAPHLTAAALTALLATAPENFTLKDLATLNDAVNRVPAGDNSRTIASLLL
jgi:hypothetical protein